MQTHISFSLRSRAIASLQSVCKTSLTERALVLRRVSGGCCPVLHSSAVTLLPPLGASALLKIEFQEQSKRAPRATGVFLKMASRSCVSGCGRFLASSDGHDRCPSCLGFRYAEAALVDESCSHCGNMTMAMLRSRYLLARRGGIPLALPRSSSSGRRTTSAQGQGDLRITVRRLLPCLDPPSTQTVSPLCVRGASIPVQGPPLRAIPVTSCLHQGRRSSPCTIKGSRHSYPQLPQRLAHPGPVSSTVVRTQEYGAQSPQPIGASGQPGKEQTLPYAEDLFSRHGVGLGQPHSTSLRGACAVNAEMPGVSPAQEGGSTETFSEASGVYGIRSRYHAARIASYETASALASRPSPEMGMAPRHVPGLTHPVLPPHLQPMVRPCFSSGRSPLRASVQACCCFNRRLYHGLGGHVQRACSRGALDRAPAAVAYQLPRVAGSMACSAPLQNAATREAYTDPFGQHCDHCVHQPPRRSTLPSHVATRPPSPPLESEASEVASRRSCPRRAQSCSRRALTSARPSGRMATPPRGTPADLETLRGRSGRPVCLPGHVSLPAVFLPVRGDPWYRCTGMQLASGPTQICVSPSEPSRTDPVQGQGGRGASPLGGALLAQSDVVPRTDAPRDSPSLENSSEEGSPFSERGHPLAPTPRLVESPRVVPGWDAEVLSGLPPAVVDTITSARALSTRQAYRLKWNLFVDWCSPRREDPRRCPITVVLSFLQDGLE